MAFVPVANTIEVAIKMTHGTERVANVIHIEKNSAWDAATLLLALTEVRTWWETETRTERSTQTCLTEICGRDLTTAGGIALCIPPGVANCGTRTENPMPGNVTVAIKKGTGLAGRAFRGRIYWVGMTDGDADVATVTPAYLTAIIGNMNELSARINTLGHTLVVVSKNSGSTCDVATCKKVPTPRSAGITTPITGFSADNTTDSQRRRLPGRGS